jgi:hypothetical protein
MYREDESLDYCDECGNTDIEKVEFSTWEKMYEEKYGQKFLNI